MDPRNFQDLDKMERPQVQVAAKTQLADDLIANGVIDPAYDYMRDDDFHLMFQNEMAKHDVNEYKSLEQLEDEQVDDDILEKFRRQRLTEMRAEAGKTKYGTLRKITELEFATECRDKECEMVVLMLYLPAQAASDVMASCLQELASKHKTVKFIKLLGDRAIKDFSEDQCPTLMCYLNGEVTAQLVGLGHFAGLKTTADVVEWELADLNVLDTQLEEDPRVANKEKYRSKTNFVRTRPTYKRGGDFSSDEDLFDESGDEEQDVEKSEFQVTY